MARVYTGKIYKTVCVNGHLLEGDNVRVRPNGSRECWACRRMRRRKENRRD